MATGIQKEQMTVKAERILAYVLDHAKEGNPTDLLATADEYCFKIDSLMNIGEKKGAIVDKIIKDLAPKTCLELGTYFGYSAVLMASVLPKGSRFLTVEASKENAEVANKFVKFAGADVNEKITIIDKASDEVIPELRKDFSVDTLDFVFIDHSKQLYMRDLQLLESHGLLRKGTVILADNMIHPGAPEYLEYVKDSEKYATEMFHCNLQYSNTADALAKSVYLVE